ncbi:hypothetical protein M9Y10_025339 [Tritrichomonas musculus]|uniref:Small GTP-binding protein n=1 Tax=Tritrichomonas musculus TaxID=1915356 RepID=A0ABR2HC45_9EUKA
MSTQTAFKITIVGDSSVGKTCIVNRAAENVFSDKYEPTVGCDFKSYTEKNVGADSVDVMLHIYDAAGQERFKEMAKIYYQNADAVLVVYAINQKTSFDSIDEWRDSILNTNPEALIFLVANKSDLYQLPDSEVNSDELLTEQDGEQKAGSLNVPFHVVSAKDGSNIHELFQTVAEACLNSKTRVATSTTNGPKPKRCQIQ